MSRCVSPSPGLSLAAAAPLSGRRSAAKPTVAQALELRPIQTEVEYDRPDAAAAAKCTLKAEPVGKHTGWVVRDADGDLLRRFVDTNGDNKVDRWCYYKDGVEVYRDIDADFNGKADQYRWLGTAGTRWGIDATKTAPIDSWKAISAEEVSAEIVAALRDKRRRAISAAGAARRRNSRRWASTTTQPEAAPPNGRTGSPEFRVARQEPKNRRERHAVDSLRRHPPGVVPEGTNGSTQGHHRL